MSQVTSARQPSNNTLFLVILPSLLLLSGFAGISYEILYGRLLGNLLGDQFLVSASVLITFLLGAGLGSVYAYRFKNGLWFIECAIGLFALLFALNYSVLENLIYSQNLLTQHLSSKMALCSLLLIIPAFLIGCSIPLFSALLVHINSTKKFAHVYSLYNIGAAITALGLEFILIRYLGINQSLWIFALINLSIAACLRFLIPADYYNTVLIKPKQSQQLLSRRLKWALIIASMASAIFQLYMLKLTELLFGPFRENFALVLAIVLVGIALGALLCQHYKIRFATLMLASIIGLGLLLVALPTILHFYAFFYPLVSHYHSTIVLFKLFILIAIMLLPATAFGATIPSLLQDETQVAKDSGYLLFISALANSAGFLIMVLLLHPYVEFGVQLLVIIGLSLIAWSLHQIQWRTAIAKAGFTLLVFITLHALLWQENLLYLSYTSFHSSTEFNKNKNSIKKTASFKGHQDIFAISEIDGTPYFFINGYISFPLDAYHEKIVGLLSAMFAPRTDNALVLGLGSGSTASVIGLTFDRTDAIEINPLVRDNLYQMKPWNFDIANNPRVNFIVDDAIHYVRASDKQYSLILNTVTSPLYFSSSKLYTLDFFHALKQRLRPDGIYSTWIDGRIGDRGFDIILKTLHNAFKHCALFYIKNTYFLLICGDVPLQYSQAQLAQRAPQVWQEFAKKYNLLADFMPYNLLIPQAFSLLADQTVPINRLDFPVLEYEMASLTNGGLPKTKQRIAEKMAIDAVQQIVIPHQADWNAAELVVEAEQTISKKYITRGWRKLVKQRITDYTAAHDTAALNYYRGVAELANTAETYYDYANALLNNKRFAEAKIAFKHAKALTTHQDN